MNERNVIAAARRTDCRNYYAVVAAATGNKIPLRNDVALAWPYVAFFSWLSGNIPRTLA